MTISVLDRNRADDAAQATLGDLHDAAGQVDDELLPCRVNNPELWFAESPSRRGVRQDAVHGLPGPRPVPRRRPRAARALGCLGRRALPPRSGDPAQASPRPSPQERGRRLTRGPAPLSAEGTSDHHMNDLTRNGVPT